MIADSELLSDSFGGRFYYIFVRSNGRKVRVKSAEIPVKVAGVGLDVVSDHLPVVVKIMIK